MYRFSCYLVLLILFAPNISWPSAEDDLRKAAQNPIANVVSLPLQNNLFYDVGPNNDVVNVLNIQPVIPITLNEEWNLITRTIAPLISIPNSVEGLDILPQGMGSSTDFGLGDVNFTAFFSPKNTKKATWGIGPTINLPTATDKFLGTEKWSTGPSFVILTQSDKWTVGALMRHLWSFAGDNNRADVNQSLAQPFVNYNMDSGWYLVSAPIITANWEKNDTSNRFLIPLGGGIGRLFTIGKQAINAQLSYYYNIEKPGLGPESSIRLQVQFMFPKK